MAHGMQIPVGLNLRPLKTGIKAARGALAGLGRGLKFGALVGGAAGLAAGMIALRKTIIGVKDAFDLGGTLSDISAQTGIAAGDLEVLRMAFDDAGISADKVGPSVNKLQRAMVEAGEGNEQSARAFADLGLNLATLRRMTPAEQFERVAGALAALPDPAQRAARAMQIFGRSGGELLTLFTDPAAIRNAKTTLGGQAEILNRSAAQFDRVSDLIKNASIKLRGIFVGIADRIAPVIQTFMEQLNRVDWSGLGQRLGDTLAKAGKVVIAMLEAMKSGEGFALAGKLLQFGVAKAVNMLWSGALRTVKFLAGALPPIFSGLFAKLRDPVFWEGIKALVGAIGATISAGISEAMGGRSEAAEYRRGASQRMKASERFMALAGDVDFGRVVEEAIGRGIEAAGKGGGSLIDTDELRAHIAEIVGRLAGPVIARETGAPTAPSAPPPTLPEGGAVEGLLKPMVSSLARIGGEAGGLLARTGLALDRERNRHLVELKRYAKETAGALRRGGTATAAAF